MHRSYTAAREHAAWLGRTDRGRIVVSGADRAPYLQGLLTNDIAALKPGTGCYSAYLTPQGRMIADMLVYELGDVVLMTVHRDVTSTVLARFDQFLFSEDVKLGDVSDTFAQIAVVGPEAADVVAGLVSGVPAPTLRALGEHGNVRVDLDGSPAIVTRTTDLGEPGFDVFVAADRPLRLDIPELTAGEAETLRIEGGVPLFHRDMDEETIPLEAGIESRAISFTKGCYVGQEVIIRVLHRGHGRVARRLVQLRIDGSDVPARGAVIRAADKDVGHVTSAAFSPRFSQPIALGYVQRDFAEPETSVLISSSSAGGNDSRLSSARVTQRIS
jgi:folate-binding protein YgfZ